MTMLLATIVPLSVSVDSCFDRVDVINTTRLTAIAANPRYSNAHDGACLRAARTETFAAFASEYQAVAGCSSLPLNLSHANVTNCASYHAGLSDFCSQYQYCSMAGAPVCCEDRVLVQGMARYPTGVDGTAAYQYSGVYLRDRVSRTGLGDTFAQVGGTGVLYVNNHLVRGPEWSIHTTHSMRQPPLTKDSMACPSCNARVGQALPCPTGEYTLEQSFAEGFFGCYSECTYTVSCDSPPISPPPPRPPLPSPSPPPPTPANYTGGDPATTTMTVGDGAWEGGAGTSSSEDEEFESTVLVIIAGAGGGALLLCCCTVLRARKKRRLAQRAAEADRAPFAARARGRRSLRRVEPAFGELGEDYFN